MRKIILNNGLLAGTIVSLWMAVSMIAIGCDNMMALGPWSMVIGYTGMLVAFSFVFVAIRNYRNTNDGTVGFWRAFGIGLLISLIASTCYVLTWFVVYHNFMPDFMDKYVALTIEQTRNSGASAEIVQAKVVEMESAKAMYKQPVNMVLMTYAEVFPIGVLVSLVSALILMRKNVARKEV